MVVAASTWFSLCRRVSCHRISNTWDFLFSCLVKCSLATITHRVPLFLLSFAAPPLAALQKFLTWPVFPKLEHFMASFCELSYLSLPLLPSAPKSIGIGIASTVAGAPQILSSSTTIFVSRHIHQVLAAQSPPSCWLTDDALKAPIVPQRLPRSSAGPATLPATLDPKTSSVDIHQPPTSYHTFTFAAVHHFRQRWLSAQRQEYAIQLVGLLWYAAGEDRIQRYCRCFHSRHQFTRQLVDNVAVRIHDDFPVCPIGLLAIEGVQPAKRFRVQIQERSNW